MYWTFLFLGIQTLDTKYNKMHENRRNDQSTNHFHALNTNAGINNVM